MSTRQRVAFRLAFAGAAIPAVVLLAAGPAIAATDVTVANTETVQAHLDSSGRVKDKRVYEQLALTGQGTIDVSNPVSAKGLRNLDGFGRYEVKDGRLVTKVSVSGEKRLRTVSDFTKDLPLDVQITYALDGRPVKPGDVVGKSGVLKVSYRVTNTTGRASSVSYDDGTGNQMSKNEQVVIPMVGSLSTTLPSTFTDVQSEQANMAGDGRGGTKLSFTMTLFPPIGSDTAEFGYTARIRDGVVPAATISALPVNPLASPSFKAGASSYAGGASTGAQLTDGAMQIDENLLRLRDGASTLLAGLLKLKDGANQLNDGLAGQAAPGAAKLAAGAGKLKSGTGELFTGTKAARAGAGVLSAGSGGLAAGANDLAGGSDDLAVGAGDLADGLGMILDGIENLPADIKKDPAFAQLKGALSGIQAGIGSSDDTTKSTLLGGLNLLRYGMRSPVGLANCDRDESTSSPLDDCGAADGAELVAQRLSDASKDGGKIDLLTAYAVGAYDYIAATSGGNCPARTGSLPPVASLQSANPGCAAAAASALGYGAQPGTPNFLDGGLKVQTAFAASSLTRVVQGIDSKVLPGISRLKAGLSNPACRLNDPRNPTNPCGVREVAGLVSNGIDQLVVAIADGLGDAVNQAYLGAGQVADGAAQVADGADQVAGGAGQVADGADRLDTGLTKITSGAGQLDVGAGRLSDGAEQLRTGLQDASSGSGLLADGLEKAAEGAPKLKDGAQQLSAQGTKVLVGKGKQTAQTFGEKYALIKAGADRAQSEAMAYGAPAGATGLTAYTLDIAGEDGEGGRSWARGLGALAVFVIGGGAAATIRQRLV